MRNWFQAFAFKCNVYRYTVAANTKQWPKFAKAQMVWKRAVAVLFSDEVGKGLVGEEGFERLWNVLFVPNIFKTLQRRAGRLFFFPLTVCP